MIFPQNIQTLFATSFYFGFILLHNARCYNEIQMYSIFCFKSFRWQGLGHPQLYEQTSFTNTPEFVQFLWFWENVSKHCHYVRIMCKPLHFANANNIYSPLQLRLTQHDERLSFD